MEQMSAVVAIKRFFERMDAVAPNGGRKVELSEISSLSPADKTELGRLACEQLGTELKA